MDRIDIINNIVRSRCLKSYLEIGCDNGSNFNKIICDHKVGIDPVLADIDYNGQVYKLTSDEFFKINNQNFDLVFIDGLHLYEQVIQDILNSFSCLNDDGFIIVHDCLPESELMAGREYCGIWTGDVYKSIIWFKDINPQIPCFVINCDYGVGVIYKNNILNTYDSERIKKYNKLSYSWFVNNLDRLDVKSPKYLEEFLWKLET